jgi:hypothetical protein
MREPRRVSRIADAKTVFRKPRWGGLKKRLKVAPSVNEGHAAGISMAPLLIS